MFLNKICACFLLLVLVAVASEAQARDTRLIGGPFGEFFRDACGPGQYLSGVYVRYGTFLESMVPFCAGYDAKTGLRHAIESPLRRHGGNGGASVEKTSCNNDQYVSGMGFSNSTDTSGRAQYLTAIQIECAPLRAGGRSSKLRIGTRSAMGGMTGYNCGDSEAVMGIIGRSGIYVDALGMMCGQRPSEPTLRTIPGQSGPGPRLDPILNQKTSSAVERNVDRPGQDYRNFDLQPSIAGFASCQSSCDADGRCKAWTYVNPGVQGPRARCWLKTSVPPATPNNCCTSGVKGAR